MEKLVLFFVLASLGFSEMRSNIVENQAEEVREFAYWEAFSQVFNKTADYWKAESAALSAESIATNRTGVESWLEENSDNIKDIKDVKKKDQCTTHS
jgi:hypothetical protein